MDEPHASAMGREHLPEPCGGAAFATVDRGQRDGRILS
jgi:hypothetical protein